MRISSRTMWALAALAIGAGLATIYFPSVRQRRSRGVRADSARVDEASEDSFPASDPPSFSGAASQPSDTPRV